jgi:hypothetical protein
MDSRELLLRNLEMPERSRRNQHCGAFVRHSSIPLRDLCDLPCDAFLFAVLAPDGKVFTIEEIAAFREGSGDDAPRTSATANSDDSHGSSE